MQRSARMRPEKYASLLLACSLISCGGAPEVTVCVSDPPSGGFQCSKPDKSTFFLKYADSANYTALSPNDLERVTEYVKRKLDKCQQVTP